MGYKKFNRKYLCFIDRLLAKYQRSQAFAKSKTKVCLWYLASNLRKSLKGLLIKLRVPSLPRCSVLIIKT